MKNFKLKSLVAALVVVGFATACDRNTAQRDAYVPPEPQTIERSTTAEGTTSPDALQSLENDPYATASDARMATAAAEVDHEETVQFSGMELTDASEEKLEDLAESLDKDKPVAVIVAMEEASADVSETSDAAASINSTTPTDSAAQNPGMANTETNPAQPEQSGEFAQRVDRVREFLQEQGVKVVRWQFEGTTQQYEAMNQQPEDIQQIRIVIANSTDTEKLGAL